MKNGVIISDTHEGSQFGLCSPPHKGRWAEWQGLMWDWYVKQIADIGKIDYLFHNAEAIDGVGKKESLELWTTDPEEQAEESADHIAMWKATKYRLTYGTPYHTVSSSNDEHKIVDALHAKGLDATIQENQRVRINGTRFHFRHAGGRSDTPYGQHTQLAKEAVRDILQSVDVDSEPADYYFRSHVHYFAFAGNDLFSAYSTPCMQWPFGVYGRKLRTQWYKIGLLYFEVDDAGEVRVVPNLLKVKATNRGYEEL